MRPERNKGGGDAGSLDKQCALMSEKKILTRRVMNRELSSGGSEAPQTLQPSLLLLSPGPLRTDEPAWVQEESEGGAERENKGQKSGEWR